MQSVPANWVGTAPEYLVYQVLTRMKIGFDFQSSQLGGRMDRGGAVLDFFIPDQGLGINIAGIYWHYERPGVIASDQLQREQLEAQGITVVYIDEDDVNSNAWYYVQEALKGNDFSRMARGM